MLQLNTVTKVQPTRVRIFTWRVTPRAALLATVACPHRRAGETGELPGKRLELPALPAQSSSKTLSIAYRLSFIGDRFYSPFGEYYQYSVSIITNIIRSDNLTYSV